MYSALGELRPAASSVMKVTPSGWSCRAEAETSGGDWASMDFSTAAAFAAPAASKIIYAPPEVPMPVVMAQPRTLLTGANNFALSSQCFLLHGLQARCENRFWRSASIETMWPLRPMPRS